MTHLKDIVIDNDDGDCEEEEKFGDLSRPLGDQFTHPHLGHNYSRLVVRAVQSRVWDKDGAGEIYCPDICPYNTCPPVQYFHYNTSTLSALQWSATLQCFRG